MPKPRPPFEPGRFYHIYNRGAHRVSIFREHGNYLFVLGKMKRYLAELQLTAIAYCLMPNHYHYLLRQDGEQRAGLLPQRVFNSYSKAYNRRYQHSGTLFEDNYKIIPVEDEAYLLHLCRYIHANPVKDGLVDRLEDWPYSNYPEWVGLRNGSMVDLEFVHTYFPDPNAYKEFVWAYLLERKHPAEVEAYLQAWGA